MLFVRLLGVVIIVLSSSLIGFLKSNSLVLKSKKLSLLLDGVNTLYEYVEQEGCELFKAIEISFSKCNFLLLENNEILFCDSDLKNDEKQEIIEFFNNLGSSTKKIECDRINAFGLKLKKMCDSAQNQVSQRCKIYQTSGVCIGLVIGILLI